MRIVWMLAAGALVLGGCHKLMAPTVAPAGALRVAAVEDPAKVELGFRLFFEPMLSAGNKMSCASCHEPGRGFSNGEPTALGVAGQRGNRNVPTILAVGKNPYFFWDGRAATLEEQALGPIQNPIEMNAKLDDVVAKLAASKDYPPRFQAAFGTGVDAPGIAKAIAAFERALTLEPSPFDRGDLTPAQQRGRELFNGRGNCKMCHKGPNFTDTNFHTTGVGLDRPNPDAGRMAISKKRFDYNAFKTPTLRNIEQTAPYMHDGSLATLEEVVDYYDKGGNPNPLVDPEIVPLGLNAQEKADLVAFMKALTSPGTNIKEIAHSRP
ncbi:MAG: Cytochrome-c peroxidase [Cyanobacteria bacterium RYN_339]|nr:Cytochrome-c peroxidase [Cyanobacteria bacterium RYN_339]